MKNLFLFTILVLSNLSFSQNLNSYKYAIVPERFLFQKENNQFLFNNLVKAAMTKYGFVTFFNSDELPDDATNKNKLIVDVIETNTMFYAKLTIVLKDYRNNVLFTSQEGRSKEKDYEAAYNDAFRQAAKSLQTLNHQYQDSQEIDLIKPVNASINQTFNNAFTAKEIKNGYNLLSNNTFVFQIFNTSKKDVFIAKKDSVSGILLKIEDNWFFEYYKNEELILEKVNITF